MHASVVQKLELKLHNIQVFFKIEMLHFFGGIPSYILRALTPTLKVNVK